MLACPGPLLLSAATTIGKRFPIDDATMPVEMDNEAWNVFIQENHDETSFRARGRAYVQGCHQYRFARAQRFGLCEARMCACACSRPSPGWATSRTTARHLRTGHSRTIGCLLPSITNPFVAQLPERGGAARAGDRLFPAGGQFEATVARQGAGGVLREPAPGGASSPCPRTSTTHRRLALRRHRLPTVIMDRDMGRVSMPC